MTGFLIGACCGVLELLLLGKLVAAVHEGSTGRVALYAFLKVILIAAAFTPVVIFLRAQLLWCGIGISAALVIGSFIRSSILRGKNRKDGEEGRP